MKPESQQTCEICHSTSQLTFHHLIPKTCHKNKWFKKRYSREFMTSSGIMLCRKCHSFLHRSYSEKHLGRELNSLETILADEKIDQYRSWASKRVK